MKTDVKIDNRCANLSTILLTQSHRLLAGFWILLTALLPGCVSWQTQVQRFGMQNTLVQTDPFRLRVLSNAAAQQWPASSGPVVWHVYIEGDGRAVTPRGTPAADPTPYQPLLLPVMGADPQPALYLGRPCYFETDDPACHPAIWTLERYSEQVVMSLVQAVRSQTGPQDLIVLIGHSGGGTLAMLLAARLPQTRAVITLAGNLDVKAWLDANHFTPLPDSLDPAIQPPLDPAIMQWHFAGDQDQIIKAEWIQSTSALQPNAHYTLVAGANHQSPWAEWLPIWLDLHRDELDKATDAITEPSQPGPPR